VFDVSWESNVRVVILLIDHGHLRPDGKLHIVVRALQPYEVLSMQDPIPAAAAMQSDRIAVRVVSQPIVHRF